MRPRPGVACPQNRAGLSADRAKHFLLFSQYSSKRATAEPQFRRAALSSTTSTSGWTKFKIRRSLGSS